MTIGNIDKLISLSKEKNQLINEMYGFTKTQEEEIKKEDMENLNEILDEKDNLIKKINKIDIEFLKVFSQIKKDEKIENISDLDPEKYPNLKELKDVVTEISSTLMTISLLDEENNKNMKKRIEETKLELKKVKEGQRAYKGYNVSMTNSILIDEKK
mgnify:CR=1 FL=1